MKNELIDVSTNTCIAQFPKISNMNNRAIEAEFNIIKDNDNTILLDISSNFVTAKSGNFTNLDVKQLNILEGSTKKTLSDYINTIVNKSQTVKTLNENAVNLQKAVYNVKSSPVATVTPQGNIQTLSNDQIVYGASQEVEEYDMSSFFSSQPSGVIKGLTVDDLYRVKLYRKMDGGIKIPLQVGTIVTGGRLRYVIYHDHIFINGNLRKIDRVFSSVVNGNDRNSVVQYEPASTITIAS